MKSGFRKLSLYSAAIVALAVACSASAHTTTPPPPVHTTPHASSSHSSNYHYNGGWHGNHGYYHGYHYYGGYPWFYSMYYGTGVTMYSDSFYAPMAYVDYVQMAPPMVVAPAAGTQPAPATGSIQPAPSNSWYYCKNPEGYYPYVKTCAGGWETVPAQPVNP